MKKKPISLILLSISFLLMPIFSLFYNALVGKLTLLEYLPLYWQQEIWLAKLEFFLFSPLIGVFIYKMTPWSYMVALSIIAWQIFSNLWVGIHEYNSNLLILLTSNSYLSAGLVYLLTPKVRNVFFNKKLQWWLSKPRYVTHIQNIILNNQISDEALICDISEGGCLLKNSKITDVGERFKLGFSLGTYSFFQEAEVVHKRDGAVGVKFINHNNETLKMALKEGNLPAKLEANTSETSYQMSV